MGDNVAFMVKAGSSTVSYSPTEQLSYADFFIHHPGYDLSTHEHDIGLIKVYTKIINKHLLINNYKLYINYLLLEFSLPDLLLSTNMSRTR